MKGVNIENREILYLVRPDHFCPAGCRLRRVAFSQLDTDATDYHPRKVAVFPVSVGSYEEARNPVEKIVPAELAAKKWFTSVIDTASLNSQIQSNNELRQLVTDYISKLNTLNYSDPELSGKISQLIDADAFYLLRLKNGVIQLKKKKIMLMQALE